MWFDILKNTKTVSQTSGSFDFEEEEIPEKTDDDCLRWVREFNALIKKFKNIVDEYDFEIIHQEPSQEHNQIVCQVLDEIKEAAKGGEFFGEQWIYKLGEGIIVGRNANWNEGITYSFQHYDGDGYQALITIRKDGKTIVDSTINSHASEPFDDYFRKILRSYDGKGKEPNPDYKGDETAKKLSDVLLEINSHFQKLHPIFKFYKTEHFKE
tara:strand:+ start:422 stop:1054 length:633 start_codon:yes stop_codon:yes gene_type:complete